MDDLVLGPQLAALSCGKPVYLVILLPGDGLSAEAFCDIAMGWAPEMIKADFQALVPPLSGGEKWFAPEGLAAAAQRLAVFIDAELERTRLPAAHLALVGFGQGAELAVAVGLTRAEPLGCLVGFSGGYGAPEAMAEKLPPTLLVHGEADETSPFAAMQALKETLKARGAPAWSFRRPGLGHEIDGDGADAAGAFLARHLKHKAASEAH